MIHHYITHYASDGKDYAEARIQINIFGMCFCLWKKRTTIERLYALDEFRQQKKSLAESLATKASDKLESIDIFLYSNYNKI